MISFRQALIEGIRRAVAAQLLVLVSRVYPKRDTRAIGLAILALAEAMSADIRTKSAEARQVLGEVK